MAAAQAHVHVDADDPVRGTTTIVTFQVPNESSTGSSTTELRVALPDVASASADVMPGWTVKLDKDVAAGTVRAVTWTATPGAGIPPDQFELFQLLVTLPDADSASFPATQTYADGTVVQWDQKPLPGGGEPEHPAPTLPLAAAGAGPADHRMPPPPPAAPGAPPAPAAPPTPATEEVKLGPDNIARALAGGALLVAAAGVGIALVRRGA
ncbi:MAG: YcnI family protein [Mycobacterium sp.]